MKSHSGLPVATYRLQLNNGFRFGDAAKIAEYLHDLNISHLYLSPIFESGKDSGHGYDVADFSKISEERGGRKQFEALVQQISQGDNALKLIIDIVPNHMAASTDNPYWYDVLARGAASPYWPLFDIKIRKSEKIEIPVLADDRTDDIKISRKGQEFCLKYFDHEYPLSPQSISCLQSNPDVDISVILDMQNYTLVPWTDAFHSVSYRRFFDVMGLIGLKVENEDVYRQAHEALFELLAEFPCIDGVRVDHIDGLADPETYLARLNERVQSVWIEKILGRQEELPKEWNTSGTTGYEFIDRMNQLFVGRENFKTIEDFWRKATGPEWDDFESCVFASRQKALNDLFLPELERLVAFFAKDKAEHKEAGIFWSGLFCGLPVYRVYPGQDLAGNEWILKACKTAEKFLGEAFVKAKHKFLPRLISPASEQEIRVTKEWQQLSGPVMAKGLEDTAHYRFTPLAALNEVGCSPVISEPAAAEYFNWLNERAKKHPLAMNATSTHDTKRAEDTRARLYALADKPQDWMDFFNRATSINASLEKSAAPSVATEYFIYQTLLGTWPLEEKTGSDYAQRIKDYMQKACREARQETGWIKPDEKYEQGIGRFIDSLLAHTPFTELVDNFAGPLSRMGALNSLSVTVLKILSPGLPDIYQGMESWDFSLVDPDNRRPVDYALRQRLLADTEARDKDQGRNSLLQHLCASWKDGGIKIWLTRELLKIRKIYLIDQSCFEVSPVSVKGRYAENLIVYTLTGKDGRQGLLAACPRYPGQLREKSDLSLDWSDTEIQVAGATNFKNLLTGKAIDRAKSVSEIFADFPIAVLSFDKI